MPDNDKMPQSSHETWLFSKIWDSLSSTAEKVTLIVCLASFAALAFVAGFQVAGYLDRANMTLMEAKHTGEINDLKHQLSMSPAQKPPENSQGWDLHISVHGDLLFTKIEPITQDVNEKYAEEPDGTRVILPGHQEAATFRFTVANDGKTPIVIKRAELLVEKLSEQHYSGQELGHHRLIDHTGHFEANLDKPKKGDCIPVPISVTVESGTSREFCVWFRSSDARKRHVVLCVTGTLRLYHDDRMVDSSDPIQIEIHSEDVGPEGV